MHTRENPFPLYRSHLDLAHTYWKQVVSSGDWAIDATCGNGKDTLKLAQLLEGRVIGLDIQGEAIEKTRALLKKRASPSPFTSTNNPTSPFQNWLKKNPSD